MCMQAGVHTHVSRATLVRIWHETTIASWWVQGGRRRWIDACNGRQGFRRRLWDVFEWQKKPVEIVALVFAEK